MLYKHTYMQNHPYYTEILLILNDSRFSKQRKKDATTFSEKTLFPRTENFPIFFLFLNMIQYDI